MKSVIIAGTGGENLFLPVSANFLSRFQAEISGMDALNKKILLFSQKSRIFWWDEGDVTDSTGVIYPYGYGAVVKLQIGWESSCLQILVDKGQRPFWKIGWESEAIEILFLSGAEDLTHTEMIR